MVAAGLRILSETMSLEAVDHQEDLPGDDGNDSNRRSERKRQREKQRRSDLSNAFDELASFIGEIEPDFTESDDPKKKRKRSGSNSGRSDVGEDASGATRLDLIGRAVRIMRRLHRKNEQTKRLMAQMTQSGQGNDNASITCY